MHVNVQINNRGRSVGAYDGGAYVVEAAAFVECGFKLARDIISILGFRWVVFKSSLTKLTHTSTVMFEGG